MNTDREAKQTIIWAFFTGLLFFVIAVTVATAFDVMNTMTFGPIAADAKREVYEHTRSYEEGNSRAILNLYQDYLTAKHENDTEHIKTIKTLCRLQVSGMDHNMISNFAPELQNFINFCFE